ncbi:hypothetical protein HPB48_007989 [Haemaphysalis longicornis]|uniref:Uncharacterized protein n=1 Tax=Haemaphysalis longicornis TaxID=44386 RepID=A0A9J6GNL2_HAELO|nr:hypothetical protein HPB48_007989 [Haemaphysalis longicornis]
MQSLSDEMEEYHGVLRYDKYTGSPKALANFMIAVGSCPVGTVYENKRDAHCASAPLDMAEAYLMLKQLKGAKVSPSCLRHSEIRPGHYGSGDIRVRGWAAGRY